MCSIVVDLVSVVAKVCSLSWNLYSISLLTKNESATICNECQLQSSLSCIQIEKRKDIVEMLSCKITGSMSVFPTKHHKAKITFTHVNWPIASPTFCMNASYCVCFLFSVLLRNGLLSSAFSRTMKPISNALSWVFYSEIRELLVTLSSAQSEGE